MSIDYSKASERPEERYFLLFGAEGPWQEVTFTTYVSAKQVNGLGETGANEDFSVEGLSGQVTTDGSRPKDSKPPVHPMVRPSSDCEDSSIRLIFPEGSYSIVSAGQDAGEDFGTVTLILSPEQYQRFLKAQAPVTLDRSARSLRKKAEGSGQIKSVVLETVADVFGQVAEDMRSGKKSQRPTLQDLKDALKG